MYFSNIKEFQFIERSDLKFKQFQIIKHFSVLFGWQNTLDYDWKILGKDLDCLIDKIVHKNAEYSSVFQVKSAKLKDYKNIDRKTFLKLVNKYLTAWGINKIVRLKKVEKQVNKVRVNYPDLYEYGFDRNLYDLTYSEPKTDC